MIYAYAKGTGIARLALQLNISLARRIGDSRDFKTFHRRFRVEPTVNWGCGWPLVGALNEDTSLARSKTKAFEAFAKAEVLCPRWSHDFDELRETVGAKRGILQREDGLRGGAGIVLIKAGAKPDAGTIGPRTFFVERLSYAREIRIHCWCGTTILSQVKVLPPQNENFVHSHANGATFSSNWQSKWISDEVMAQAQAVALKAVEALGLDFGAVDLMLTRKGRLYVLEVNTAPGLQSAPTQEAYTKVLEPLRRLAKPNARARRAKL